MTRVRALVFLALFAPSLLAAPPAPPAPTPTPTRYRLGDSEPSRSRSLLRRIENALPVALLIFLGIRSGNVHIGGSVGTSSAGATNQQAQ